MPVIDADAERVEAAIAMAARIVEAAHAGEQSLSRGERARRRRLSGLVADPAAKQVTFELSDEVLRIADPVRAARRLAALGSAIPPGSFAPLDRLLLRLGARVAPLLPRVVMPIVAWRLRREAGAVVLSAADPDLAAHLVRRRAEGVVSNVNLLGEAILGDGEARRRLEAVVERLGRPDVSYVSVKISAICAGVSSLAFDTTVDAVAERLRLLYCAAAAHSPAKFVNLDMEEYRDLELTMEVFRRVLDEPEFTGLEAGIVVQAYLPDAQEAAHDLAEWARLRRERGGAGIKIRLVKGANLAMEAVDAELHDWHAAPFTTKAEVDANYKAVLDVLLDPRYDDAVRVGVASHNLFDVAWALVLRREMLAAGRADRLEIEMLEGMAPAQAAEVRAESGSLLLYTPVVAPDDFPAAIAYLVRRLDENTAPQNFLTHLATIRAGSQAFAEQAAAFRAAVAARHTVSSRRRRSVPDRLAAHPLDEPFFNEPDTDWALPENRSWLAAALDSYGSSGRVAEPTAAPGLDDVERAIRTALDALPAWAEMSGRERAEMLARVGDIVSADRGATLAAMVHTAAKTVAEADPEISEAADFCRYYARQSLLIDELHASGARSSPLGVVVIAPPWNFPYAIPMGGVIAALAAGNTVILKPAPPTVEVARIVAEQCWAAGVPRQVLQFLPCVDDDAGRRLISHPDVAAVILTGAHETARMFLGWRPSLQLHAETSGKNAMVITAAADRDLAVKDLVRSAFGHAGQKCSAASLAIIEASLYDDPAFIERLRDAVTTLRVGPSTDVATDVGPLIAPPSGPLARALTSLEPGESWLVEPRQVGDDPRLWSPGVRGGVQPGSWFATTECFGPVLGLIRARDLDHAIEIQNSTDFGLTAGMHSLDPAEIDQWTDRVEAGNLYVNRGTTGAIVRRQPFGGWKRSVVGPAAKAGGPNYVNSFRRWHGSAPDAGDIAVVAGAFEHWAKANLGAGVDPTGLAAERNTFRYRPLRGVVLRCSAVDRGAIDVARAAATATGVRLVISLVEDETDTDLARRLPALGVDRLRLAGPTTAAVLVAAHDAGIAVDPQPPVPVPAVELPRWFREQAVSRTLHRHGHLSPPVGLSRPT